MEPNHHSDCRIKRTVVRIIWLALLLGVLTMIVVFANGNNNNQTAVEAVLEETRAIVLEESTVSKVQQQWRNKTAIAAEVANVETTTTVATTTTATTTTTTTTTTTSTTTTTTTTTTSTTTTTPEPTETTTVVNVGGVPEGAILEDTMKITAYCPHACCCGQYSVDYTGVSATASGKTPVPWYTVAAGSQYAFGTKFFVEELGITVEVMDRGGSVSSSLDMFQASHEEALAFPTGEYTIWRLP